MQAPQLPRPPGDSVWSDWFVAHCGCAIAAALLGCAMRGLYYHVRHWPVDLELLQRLAEQSDRPIMPVVRYSARLMDSDGATHNYPNENRVMQLTLRAPPREDDRAAGCGIAWQREADGADRGGVGLSVAHEARMRELGPARQRQRQYAGSMGHAIYPVIAWAIACYLLWIVLRHLTWRVGYWFAEELDRDQRRRIAERLLDGDGPRDHDELSQRVYHATSAVVQRAIALLQDYLDGGPLSVQSQRIAAYLCLTVCPVVVPLVVRTTVYGFGVPALLSHCVEDRITAIRWRRWKRWQLEQTVAAAAAAAAAASTLPAGVPPLPPPSTEDAMELNLPADISGSA